MTSEGSDLRRIAALLKPERVSYFLGLGSLLCVNVADAFAPVFMAVALDLTEAELTQTPAQTPPLLDLLGIQASHFTIDGAIIAYLCLLVCANIARYPMLMNTAVPSHRIGQTIRRKISDYLLGQSQTFYDGAKSGDLMNFATSDVNAVRMMLGPGLVIGFDTISLVSLVLLVMFGLSWQLTLVALIPVPIIILFTNKLSHREYETFEDVQEDIGEMTERVRESYAGIRLIQGFARESFDRERFDQYSWRHYLKNLKLARIRAVFDPTLDVLMGLSTTLVFGFGGWLVVEGRMTLGTFVAFIFLIRYVSGPMIGFGWSVSLYQRGKASLRRLEKLWNTPVAITSPTHPDVFDGEGHIQIKNLSFGYGSPQRIGESFAQEVNEDELALKHIDLDIPAGHTLGIVGAVGSGKSTLARLLVRLYEPPRGTLFFDGHDVRDLDLQRLREHVVLAPQNTFLFSDTVARNISLTEQEPEVTQHYAQLAALHDELEELPEGYATMLGERGVNLSGGQRQRLAIARAIATDPKVLILDDCLSAVDAHTEEAILENLREVFDGRTGIIISHRVRAVQRCDQIVVIEAGAIMERGSHDELLAMEDGIYARIAKEQTKEQSHDKKAS